MKRKRKGKREINEKNRIKNLLGIARNDVLLSFALTFSSDGIGVRAVAFVSFPLRYRFRRKIKMKILVPINTIPTTTTPAIAKNTE
jgi:hypothetical protein